MINWLDRFLNSGLDPNTTEPFELLRYRRLVSVAITILAIGTAFMVRAVQWQISSRILAIGILMVVMATTLVGVRYYRNLAFYSHLMIAASYVVCVNAVITNGGVSPFTGAWLVVPPLFAQVLLGRRIGWFWLLASICALVVLYTLEFQFGYRFEDQTPEPYRAGQQLLQLIGLSLAVFLLANTFLVQLDLAKSKLLEQLRASQHEVVQRRKAENIAVQASNAKSQFLANMSHELRTPLNAIIGFSKRIEVKASDRLNERELDALGGVIKNGEHLLSLINELLDMAKIEAGRFELSLQTVDLVKVTQESIDCVKPIAEKEGIRIEASLGSACSIHADPKRLKQIIINFLSNGIKYTEQGCVSLTIEQADREVRLIFQDTGIGISGDDLERVFDEYNHIHSKLHNEVQTTGLGMPLSAKLIHQHGGSVTVDSELGVGSTFTVTLPRDMTVQSDC